MRTSDLVIGLSMLSIVGLSSPGVRVARAGDDAAPGAVCQAGAPRAPALQAEMTLERLRHELRAEAQGAPPAPSDVPIPLDNRGFNYGPPPPGAPTPFPEPSPRPDP